MVGVALAGGAPHSSPADHAPRSGSTAAATASDRPVWLLPPAIAARWRFAEAGPVSARLPILSPSGGAALRQPSRGHRDRRYPCPSPQARQRLLAPPRA